MHQARQFTKRRPQSPSIYQQQAVDALQVGINKPALPRSGLAIQSNAPLHVSHRSSPVIHHQNTETHEHHHEHDYKTHSTTTVINPYAPVNHNHQAHDEGHNHFGHQHSQHNHEAHQHDHMGHDHHHHHDGHEHHDHHEHNHAHDTHQHSGHNHHGHDHHNHDHKGHDHSGHSHNFPQVYTQPLPSYSSIFASLTPSQKALFTYFFGHFAIGIIVWWLGAARESLSIVGFSYLVLFDAFGTLNNVVSSVLHLNPIFTATSTKRPFGVKRFEVVFALANAIFLLFGTMYTTKESLEHLLLENHHSVDHHSKSSFPFGLLFMLLVAIGASFGSNTGLRNHENLVNLRNKSSQMQSEYSYTDIKSVGGNPLDSLKRNIYSLSIISTGSIVFLLSLFNITSPTLDKFLAFGESALMLYLGGPTAAALAKVLLQTMPDSIVSKVDYNIRQVQQNQNILSVDKVHFWQNSYGKCIGTAEVFAKPEANEDDVLDATFDILENLVKDNDGELTISVTKRE